MPSPSPPLSRSFALPPSLGISFHPRAVCDTRVHEGASERARRRRRQRYSLATREDVDRPRSRPSVRDGMTAINNEPFLTINVGGEGTEGRLDAAVSVGGTL